MPQLYLPTDHSIGINLKREILNPRDGMTARTRIKRTLEVDFCAPRSHGVYKAPRVSIEQAKVPFILPASKLGHQH